VLATERRLLARTPVLPEAPLGDARLRLKRHSPRPRRTDSHPGCWPFPISGSGGRGVIAVPVLDPRRHVGREGEALLRSRPLCPSLLRQRDLSGVGFAMLGSQQRGCGRRFHEVRDPPVSPVRAFVFCHSPVHGALPEYARSSAFTASSPPRNTRESGCALGFRRHIRRPGTADSNVRFDPLAGSEDAHSSSLSLHDEAVAALETFAQRRGISF